MTKPCILLDVDGIFADFVTPCLDAVHAHTGKRFHHDDVIDWDIMKSCGIDDEMGAAIYKSMQVKNLCYDIPAYAGAREGVDKLREWAEVIAVTSPFGGEHWMHERDRWMVQKMGFVKDDVMHVRSTRKYRVWGDAFVEDKTQTLRTYREHHPECASVLFLRNYNKGDGWDGLCADGWPHLVTLLEHRLRR